MQSTADRELLTQYVEGHSEEAFAGLVNRYVPLVYSVALRCVGDPNQAEEIAQSVFIILSRKAAELREAKALSSWLFQTTRLTARNVVRSELRRRQREQEAHMQTIRNDQGTDVWPRIAPLLDDAVARLNEKDRQAIILRFYEGRKLREVGFALSTSEDAAEKRINRALEKLRTFFARQGVSVGASGLAVILSANAVGAAPASLAFAITTATATAALGGTPLVGTAAKVIVMSTLQKVAIGTAVAAALGTGLYTSHKISRLRVDNQRLTAEQHRVTAEREAAFQRLAKFAPKPVPKNPAPPFDAQAPTGDDRFDREVMSTNLIAQLLRGNQPPKLTAGQVESYLKENQRSAASLLAAFRTTGDAALLEEAKQRFPRDPQVAFEAGFKQDISLEDQRTWFDALQQSAPENSLAHYLSALNHFKSGKQDQALRDLITASAKTEFHDYTLERVQDDEEAYSAAGYSVADAKTASAFALLLPQLAQMKELSQTMMHLADAYRQSGDSTSAGAAIDMVATLGRRYSIVSPGEAEISQLVGIAIERTALNAMDPNSPYGSDGRTVRERLEQLVQQKAKVSEIAQQTEALQPAMTEQDWISYKDRWRNFGEEAAGRWLINKYGPK